jgi:phosphopantothenoylcysteine synthetase/decarboxylase
MLKQETYETWADGFATSIGVAQTIRYNDTDGVIPPVEYRKFKKEMGINKKILKAIDDGRYEELQRWIYKIGREDGRLKEGTIIKRAFDKIYGKEKVNTTSGEIL